MYSEHPILLNFSLLNDFASVAAKQFKILTKCSELNINRENPPIAFPSKQLCLEIIARGFGFDCYKSAKDDHSSVELRRFVLPNVLFEKYFFRLNSECNVGAGFYLSLWIETCQRIFEYTFSLKHSVLQAHIEVSVAKFDNYALVFETPYMCNLFQYAIGTEKQDVQMGERENALFALNAICLLWESNGIKIESRSYTGSRKSSRALGFTYRQLFRKTPQNQEHLEAALEYVGDVLYEANLQDFTCQLTMPKNLMDTYSELGISDVFYEGGVKARYVQRDMQICKKHLDGLIKRSGYRHGLNAECDLNWVKHGEYRDLYRKVLVAVGLFVENGETGFISLNKEQVFNEKSKYLSQNTEQLVYEVLTDSMAVDK